jgi:hypothetical protein
VRIDAGTGCTASVTASASLLRRTIKRTISAQYCIMRTDLGYRMQHPLCLHFISTSQLRHLPFFSVPSPTLVYVNPLCTLLTARKSSAHTRCPVTSRLQTPSILIVAFFAPSSRPRNILLASYSHSNQKPSDRELDVSAQHRVYISFLLQHSTASPRISSLTYRLRSNPSPGYLFRRLSCMFSPTLLRCPG